MRLITHQKSAWLALSEVSVPRFRQNHHHAFHRSPRRLEQYAQQSAPALADCTVRRQLPDERRSHQSFFSTVITFTTSRPTSSTPARTLELGGGWKFDTRAYTYRYWNKRNYNNSATTIVGLVGVDKLNGYRHAGDISTLSQESKWGILLRRRLVRVGLHGPLSEPVHPRHLGRHTRCLTSTNISLPRRFILSSSMNGASLLSW